MLNHCIIYICVHEDTKKKINKYFDFKHFISTQLIFHLESFNGQNSEPKSKEITI